MDRWNMCQFEFGVSNCDYLTANFRAAFCCHSAPGLDCRFTHTNTQTTSLEFISVTTHYASCMKYGWSRESERERESLCVCLFTRNTIHANVSNGIIDHTAVYSYISCCSGEQVPHITFNLLPSYLRLLLNFLESRYKVSSIVHCLKSNSVAHNV